MCTLGMTCHAIPLPVPAADGDEGDAALVTGLQNGDELAFRTLVETYRSKVYQVICSIIRDGDVADEIAQEVFAKVYFEVGSFNGRSALFTWIYRIAVNQAYGYLRKNRTRLACERRHSSDAVAQAANSVADTRPSADRELAGRQLLHMLLERLPEDERSLLLLKEVEGLSIARLSELTGTNESTVKVRLFRTRQKLALLAARLTASRGARRKGARR